MKKLLKTIKILYLFVNNPVTRFVFKTVFLFMAFLGKWFIVLVVGPLSLFVFKRSLKHAFTRTLPKILKKYFTVTFPKILKKKLAMVYPVNMVMSFFKQ